MLRRLRLDLHVHSCLSPCGDYGMTPENILRRARALGLAGIALCDHNTAENVPAFRRAGSRMGVSVVGGMEVTTREEAHVLAYFDEWERLEELQSLVYQALDGRNDEQAFGPQIVVDEQSEPLGLNERLLMGATTLSIREVVDHVHRLGGLAVAAHVDRPSFSVVSQLGFVPPDLRFDALEVSPRCEDRSAFADCGLPLLSSSDAHYVHEVGHGSTVCVAAQGTVAELVQALSKNGGRHLEE